MSSVAKAALALRRFYHVTRLSQGPITFAKWQSFFQVHIKVLLTFTTSKKAYEARVRNYVTVVAWSKRFHIVEKTSFSLTA